MLENLHIKNVALIDELNIDFGPGLNILTGETGAGKSILIDSINFVLGERTSKELIRTGSDEASVSALISVNCTGAAGLINELGFDTEDSILITRTLNSSGKSTCRINGRMVNTTLLKEISALLVDIHGQHQHQSLLSSSKHITLLDKFCGDELEKERQEFSALYKSYKDIIKEINSISGDEADRERVIDLLTYQTTEIKDANLSREEEEGLLERRKILNNIERISRNTHEAINLIYGDESNDTSAIDNLSRALNLIRDIGSMDTSKEEMVETMENVLAQLSDVASELRYYLDEFGDESDELEQLESRLNLIYNLKRKYGGSIDEILKFYKEKSERLSFILNSEEELLRLNKVRKKIESGLEASAKKLSDMRKSNATKIEKGVVSALKDLGMKNAVFNIVVEKKMN